jgi:hypothetical protein
MEMRGRDEKGCYVKYGESGKKYYYPCGNQEAKQRAEERALKQARAMFAAGYRGEE